MLSTRVLDVAMRDALAADTTTIASASALKVHLIAAPFTPGKDTDLSTLTEATFTGSTALAAGAAPQQTFLNPLTGKLVIQMKEPAGGWHWQASVDPASPETIYGWVLCKADGTKTYGSQLFETPVVITVTGDAVDIHEVRFEQDLNPMV